MISLASNHKQRWLTNIGINNNQTTGGGKMARMGVGWGAVGWTKTVGPQSEKVQNILPNKSAAEVP